MAEFKVVDPSTGITIVPERDNRLTEFSKKLITDYYLKEGETIQEGFARAAFAWSSDDEHAQRLYDGVSLGWFMFASPVFSNAPAAIDHVKRIFEKVKSMPISCFALAVNDNLESIISTSTESRWLSVLGGGVGIAVSDIRASSYKSLGVIPLLHTYDADMEYFRQGKCYTPETEILTSSGWKRFDTLDGSEEVCQVDENNKASFVKPTEFVKEYHSGKIINFISKNRICASVTPNHSMVVERKRKNGWTGKLEKIRADEISFHSEVKMYFSTTVENEFPTSLTSHEKFLIALQADGSLDKKVNGSNCGTISCVFHFSKPRKILEMKKLLNECGYDYSCSEKDTTKFYVRVPKNLIMSKTFNWVNLKTANTLWAKEFIEEISKWDSCDKRDENRGIIYSSINKECSDIVNAIATLANYGSTVSERHKKDKNHNIVYDTYISFGRNNIKHARKTESEYSGFVYCCLVPEGKIVVRHDGNPLVCGNTRRGSIAAYMDVSHPDLIEFLNIRVPTGDVSRKCHSAGFHNAINITDAFMEAVLADDEWNLIDPHDKTVRDTMSARDLWNQILDIRYRTGEPYLNFIDTANRYLPDIQKKLGLKIKSSNLCNEIMLPTNDERTFVCCLSSLNLEKYDEWKDTSIVRDLIRMLDNIIEFFVKNAPDVISKAKYSAYRERALGLGVMGFHNLLMKNMIPFESLQAKELNKNLFKFIENEAHIESLTLGKELGEAPDIQTTLIFDFDDEQLVIESSDFIGDKRAFEYAVGDEIDGYGEIIGIEGLHDYSGRRNTQLMALAPTANSAILCGTSPSIEPINSNAYIHQTRAGSWPIKNHYLEKLLDEKGFNTEEVWKTIIGDNGSVQSLEFLSKEEKKIFKTAIELNQMWVVEHASDRQPFISQGQSINLFFPAKCSRDYFNKIHVNAWKKGLKGLYYVRTMASNRPDAVSKKITRVALKDSDDGECVACQG